MKRCSDCDLDKPVTDFARQRTPEERGEERTADGLNTYCRRCSKQRQQRDWYGNNKEKVRAQVDQWRKDNPEARKKIAREYARKTRWAKLGLTHEQYDAMVEECGDACLGCQRPFSVEVPACVDHCHDSGAIRGLLCHACNLSIGYAQDDSARLDALAAYLRSHGR